MRLYGLAGDHSPQSADVLGLGDSIQPPDKCMCERGRSDHSNSAAGSPGVVGYSAQGKAPITAALGPASPWEALLA